MRVKTIQIYLQRLGYNCGEVDGVYGKDTETAVRRFQRDHGIVEMPGTDDLTTYVLEHEAKAKGFTLVGDK